MGKIQRPTIEGPDEFDILSAIWILASNDENPIITYKGINYRLGLPGSYDVKKLISSRGDIFRRGVPANRLREWKDQMHTSKHLPSWIRDIEESSARSAAINALTSEDVFRSQFRAERDAEKSPIEIIDWGLHHIDRLRKASLEARGQSAQSWQVWLVFGIGVVNIIVTILLAITK